MAITFEFAKRLEELSKELNEVQKLERKLRENIEYWKTLPYSTREYFLNGTEDTLAKYKERVNDILIEYDFITRYENTSEGMFLVVDLGEDWENYCDIEKIYGYATTLKQAKELAEKYHEEAEEIPAIVDANETQPYTGFRSHYVKDGDIWRYGVEHCSRLPYLFNVKNPYS